MIYNRAYVKGGIFGHLSPMSLAWVDVLGHCTFLFFPVFYLTREIVERCCDRKTKTGCVSPSPLSASLDPMDLV